MSHFKERKEKVCLNCNAELQGRFCHKCGQENIEPKESFFHLLSHLISHEFHFDSKFFSTAKYLLLKPGFLTKEYMAGRRVSYLDPIRMYIFLSAFFFLVVFSLNKGENNIVNANIDHLNDKKEAKSILKEFKSSTSDSSNTEEDSITDEHNDGEKKQAIDAGKNHRSIAKDSVTTDSVSKTSAGEKEHGFTFLGSSKYKSLAEYDSIQKALPENEKDNFLVRAFSRKVFEQKSRLEENPKEFTEHIKEEMIHSVSEIFFLSLPFFALILQLLYLRNRMNFYYVNHFIYTLHLFSGVFFIYLTVFLLDKLKSALSWHWLNYLSAIVAIYGVYFSYKSLRTFYGQSRRKTMVKFALLSFLSIILFALLFIIFLLISASKA